MRDNFGSLDEARYALARQAVAAQPESPDLLFALAEILAARRDYDEYARVFKKAYLRRPSAQPAIKEALPPNEAAALRDATQALIERGIHYAPVLAAHALACAMLGDKTTTAALVDYEKFFRLTLGVMPHDFNGGDFYGALAAEIKSGLTFFDTPERRAIRQAWRNDNIMNSDLPACRAFAAEIHRQVAAYIDALPAEADHPFIVSRPQDFRIAAWAVVSGTESHHVAHIHHRAWLSGVYYVVRPAISRAPGSERGFLRVGPPEHLGAADRGWAERQVAPEPGNLVIMPAYFYHDTKPMGVEQERICIAFDVMPLELSGGGRRGAGAVPDDD